MEYRVRPAKEGVFIDINDPTEGWLSLFGANSRGDFVGMPTCWPFDERSDPTGDSENIIMLDIDLLLQKKTLQEILAIAKDKKVCSVPGVTYMSSLSDRDGNVLHIIPGQGYKYYEKTDHATLTNFSPFKQDAEQHPWMGWDRYHKAEAMIQALGDDFFADDCFTVLKEVSQEVCPTVVSMVYDVSDKTVFWCENRNRSRIESLQF